MPARWPIRPTKNFFCQKVKDVESFWGYIVGAESENAFSFAELALVLEIFLLSFFIILLEHGAFSSLQSFFNEILLVSHSKFSVHLLHTTYMYIDSYKNKS